MKFHIMWPTVRPTVMKRTCAHWIRMRTTITPLSITVAVNTKQQKEQLGEYKEVLVVGNIKKGPVHATNVLAKHVHGNPSDIVLLVSDDFFAPHGWDKFLLDQFKNFNGCLLVDDGYQYGGCVTIPIMTYNCLLKLNRIIYHPSYIWQYSDAELYFNLRGMKLLKDVRRIKGTPLFEHRHWANGKRKTDAHDKHGIVSGGKDHQTFKRRMKMSITDRIKC
jgi:hypothetical protein